MIFRLLDFQAVCSMCIPPDSVRQNLKASTNIENSAHLLIQLVVCGGVEQHCVVELISDLSLRPLLLLGFSSSASLLLLRGIFTSFRVCFLSSLGRHTLKKTIIGI